MFVSGEFKYLLGMYWELCTERALLPLGFEIMYSQSAQFLTFWAIEEEFQTVFG